MTRALLLSVLLAASISHAREKVRPKSNVSPQRQNQQLPPAPTPPPEDSAQDDNPPDDTTSRGDVKDKDDDAPPANLFDDDDDDKVVDKTTGKKRTKTKEEEDQDVAVGLATLCCCFIFLAGLVGLIVWLVRRKPGATVPPPNVYRGGQPAGGAGPFHLSVAAIALDARTRGTVDARFNALGGAGNAGAPPTKGAISRALAQALLEQKDHWRWFGYGEKPLMYAFGEADISFRAATDDFRARANTAAAGPEGELVIYTLVCCANRLLKGVTRLDSLAEAQEVFLERSRVQDHEVFGGEVIASPLSGGMSEAELTQRYPEMNRLVSAVG